MNRERFAWIVSVLLIAMLALQIPGTLAQRDDDYAFVRTLIDIQRQVATHYADPIDQDKLREGAIRGLLGQLDPFSMYVPPSQREDFERLLEGSFRGVGIMLDQLETGQIVVITPIDNSPAFRAGVMAGDVILAVDGESIEGMRLQEIIPMITGDIGSEVTLRVRQPEGNEVDLTMVREEIIVPPVQGFARTQEHEWDYFAVAEPAIGYLRITQFTGDTLDRVRVVVNDLLDDGMQGLILDLRFNPGGRLDQAVQLVDLFIDEGRIVSTMGRNRPERVEMASSPGTLPYFPMVVLVNEQSASAAEIVAGSLMDNRRATVIGTRTYGKGSVQELIPLDGDHGELKLTVAYYYLPSGVPVHRKPDAEQWGVQPQILVEMDQEAQRQARMERFEREAFRRPAIELDEEAPAEVEIESADTQLQQAIRTIVGLVVLEANRGVEALSR